MIKQEMLSAVEDHLGHLRSVLDALELLAERFSIEGYQVPEQFNESTAINFCMRFNPYLSTLYVALRDMRHQIEGLDSIVEKCYKKEITT